MYCDKDKAFMTSLRLTRQQAEDLTNLARKRGVTVSEAMRQMIAETTRREARNRRAIERIERVERA